MAPWIRLDGGVYTHHARYDVPRAGQEGSKSQAQNNLSDLGWAVWAQGFARYQHGVDGHDSPPHAIQNGDWPRPTLTDGLGSRRGVHILPPTGLVLLAWPNEQIRVRWWGGKDDGEEESEGWMEGRKEGTTEVAEKRSSCRAVGHRAAA